MNNKHLISEKICNKESLSADTKLSSKCQDENPVPSVLKCQKRLLIPENGSEDIHESKLSRLSCQENSVSGSSINISGHGSPCNEWSSEIAVPTELQNGQLEENEPLQDTSPRCHVNNIFARFNRNISSDSSVENSMQCDNSSNCVKNPLSIDLKIKNSFKGVIKAAASKIAKSSDSPTLATSSPVLSGTSPLVEQCKDISSTCKTTQQGDTGNLFENTNSENASVESTETTDFQSTLSFLNEEPSQKDENVLPNTDTVMSEEILLDAPDDVELNDDVDLTLLDQSDDFQESKNCNTKDDGKSTPDFNKNVAESIHHDEANEERNVKPVDLQENESVDQEVIATDNLTLPQYDNKITECTESKVTESDDKKIIEMHSDNLTKINKNSEVLGKPDDYTEDEKSVQVLDTSTESTNENNCSEQSDEVSMMCVDLTDCEYDSAKKDSEMVVNISESNSTATESAETEENQTEVNQIEENHESVIESTSEEEKILTEHNSNIINTDEKCVDKEESNCNPQNAIPCGNNSSLGNTSCSTNSIKGMKLAVNGLVHLDSGIDCMNHINDIKLNGVVSSSTYTDVKLSEVKDLINQDILINNDNNIDQLVSDPNCEVEMGDCKPTVNASEIPSDTIGKNSIDAKSDCKPIVGESEVASDTTVEDSVDMKSDCKPTVNASKILSDNNTGENSVEMKSDCESTVNESEFPSDENSVDLKSDCKLTVNACEIPNVTPGENSADMKPVCKPSVNANEIASDITDENSVDVKSYSKVLSETESDSQTDALQCNSHESNSPKIDTDMDGDPSRKRSATSPLTEDTAVCQTKKSRLDYMVGGLASRLGKSIDELQEERNDDSKEEDTTDSAEEESSDEESDDNNICISKKVILLCNF